MEGATELPSCGGPVQGPEAPPGMPGALAMASQTSGLLEFVEI